MVGGIITVNEEANEIRELQEMKKSEDDLMQIMKSAWAPEPSRRNGS